MHIHAGQLNTIQSTHGAHNSTALAARRAEETRKKLFASAMEPDVATIPDSPWAISMTGAWGEGNTNGSAVASHSEPTGESDAEPAVSPTPASSMVSFWA